MNKAQVATLLVITTLLVSIFCVATASAATTPPSIDTTANSHSIQSLQFQGSASLSITTSTTQEIVYATFYSVNTGYGLSISSSPSLTWHYRGGGNTTSANGEIAAWWALSSTPQTIQITFTSSQSNNKNYVLAAFCVINADPNSPFDPNVNSASFTHANSASPSASVTTTSANDLVIGVLGIINNKAITVGSGYTIIDSLSAIPSGANEYRTVAAAGTYTPNFTIGSGAWVEIADAFVGTTLSVLPEYSFGGLTGFVVCLAAMLVFFKGKKAAQSLKIKR